MELVCGHEQRLAKLALEGKSGHPCARRRTSQTKTKTKTCMHAKKIMQALIWPSCEGPPTAMDPTKLHETNHRAALMWPALQRSSDCDGPDKTLWNKSHSSTTVMRHGHGDVQTPSPATQSARLYCHARDNVSQVETLLGRSLEISSSGFQSHEQCHTEGRDGSQHLSPKVIRWSGSCASAPTSKSLQPSLMVCAHCAEESGEFATMSSHPLMPASEAALKRQQPPSVVDSHGYAPKMTEKVKTPSANVSARKLS